MDITAHSRIRRVTAEDLPRVHEIAVAAWRPSYERCRLIRGEKMWHDLVEGWEKGWQCFTDGRAIVTEIEGEVVGFARWRPISKVLAEVGGNAVDPRWQNQGIGAAQVRWVIDMLREEGYRCATVFTGLESETGPARAIYRKAGFRCGLATSAYFNYLEEVDCLSPKEGLCFRWANAADASRVQEFAESVWDPVYEAVRQTVGNEIFAFVFENAFAQRVQGLARSTAEPEKMRLLVTGGELAGLSVLELHSHPLLAKIMTVAVHPVMRGRGFGLNLARDAFCLFRQRGKRYAQLNVNPGELNETTRRFAWSVGLYRESPSIEYYQLLRA